LRRVLAAAALVAALAGCAAPAGPTRADPAPAPVRLSQVPFVAQPQFQCGPASLAMAMAVAGRPVPVERLAADSFVPGRGGTLQAEMLAAPRRHGLLATEIPGTADALRRELDAGHPVIVLQNLALPWIPYWHYAVVVGDEPAAGRVLLHTGDEPWAEVTWATFDRLHARSGRWAMVVTPASQLPASAREPAVVQAVIGLERVDAAAAAPAWDALVSRWPHSRLGRFGRANARLARNDPVAAIADYRAALAVDAGFADAWNNLAHGLAAVGDPAGARAAAERAVALGGARAAAYRDTLASLPAPTAPVPPD
jgi:hypothetical protein